ncbi:DegT/DnrJ/EryC1/StrS aminotransferase family protein [Roseibium sp. RKSG952]|uniref:DegT/DnrJ/EryC1/StrS family aminotransferase n=1 Tax=Roseibium sp. RKSG952 TaxID=2529384 RepID=UPI0012BBA7A6|nr:DegT/DnrJ/EryC1/StrS family aminotransferase [Roseibium sp. RKSG952]MTH95253.1 DegT/DnrJ/EryC1/StrS family aminotransferase [Roseibium sp. RKSG952]
MQFIDLHTQQNRIKDRLDVRIAAVLEHGRYILGPEVSELEESLSAFVGGAECVTCANGTDALQIALMALDIGPNDEVIIPAFNYIACAEAVAILGALPVFADVDERTYNLCPLSLESKITPRTKAVIAVSLYGQCADFERINAIAVRHNLPVIEDAAQSFGGAFEGRVSCGLTTIACTSFFPSKPLGCYGDGGALFAANRDLAKSIRKIARHGQERRYQHVRLGVNSRLDTIQAAILLCKLEVFEDELTARQSIAERYSKALEGLGIITPYVDSRCRSAWAQYTIQVDNRDVFISHLKSAGVPTAIHYPRPLHKQLAFKDDDVVAPISEKLSDHVFSLPMHPYLTEQEMDRVVSTIQEAREANLAA